MQVAQVEIADVVVTTLTVVAAGNL
ncbi:hypothetical protein IL54_1574 [Sphingobium sp. ba1]|nr:hypothetical protein IL54_1574 [Sphingobium sp. ba1]